MGKNFPDRIVYGLYGEENRPVAFGVKNDQPYCQEVVNGKLVNTKIFASDASQEAAVISKSQFDQYLTK